MTIPRTTPRLFILSTFLLLAFGHNSHNGNLQAAPLSRHARHETPRTINSTNSTSSINSINTAGSNNAAQPDASLGITANRGALALKAGAAGVASNMRIRLRHGDGSASTLYELEAAGQDAGNDEGGRYERLRYRLKPAAPAPGATPAPQLQAVLEFRRYLRPEVLIATLDYDGPPLAARDGIQLVMGLDNFARGMAIKRFKLYWTAPVFVSDHRLLSPANVMLLWQQTAGDSYHTMIPLAGDGMVSEVGVSEIEYRPEFRVSASSHDPRFAPRRVPLFAYATSRDPYQLPRDAYRTAFAATEQYGRLRWQKTLPEPFGWLGWCSWNAYEQTVSEEKILASARSLADKQIPVGFMLIDDGWLSVKGQKLAGFDADPAKFPRGLEATARALREQYRMRHVGVWHTFQGYWTGVDLESPLARDYKLFRGREGNALPDPREGRGAQFYADWYAKLKGWGFDFVKVDGQANNVKFTDGLMPLFVSAGGSQRNLQEAAQKHFNYDGRDDDRQRADSVGVINCMEMTLENAYNWRTSNVARNSDDYLPEVAHNFKDHIFQNAYNAYWMSNFAYPDWDMFQSHDQNAAYHAVARAISGGPVYFTDEPGKERGELLRPLAFSDGRLLMLDEPGQVTRDLLFTDVSIQPSVLKVFGRITRPGLGAGMVAAFNANKRAPVVWGALTASDVEGFAPGAEGVAVYRQSDATTTLLRGNNPVTPLTLAMSGYDLFTLSPVEGGVAVFGLLDKYLGPAAVVSVSRQGRQQVEVRLHEAGDFGAWLESAPARVELDGKTLPASAYSYERNLLRIPRATFGAQSGERRLRLQIAARRKQP